MEEKRNTEEELAAEEQRVIDSGVIEPEKAEDKPKYYVAIGASAGGLEALQAFFDNMPADSGLAFIVVQHLSPDYKSLMVELLSKHTRMEVLRVEDGVAIRPNRIYLIPPKKNMAVYGGHLYLSEQPDRRVLNLPVDVLFRSLAEDQGERVIGIVLSGTGSDGTRGVQAVKEQGGMVLVQDELTARFDGMPRSAIVTGIADYVLSPQEMPGVLLQFITPPYIGRGLGSEATIAVEEDSFTRLLGLLQRKTRVDFTHYKPATVVRRIERRMGIVQARSLDDYIAYVVRNPSEMNLLFKDLLIGVTKFFRDTESFKALARTVVPELVDKAAKERRPVRIWVPGCASGEEAYSLAILFQQCMDESGKRVEVKLFATDLDKEAVEFAGIGRYPESIAADVEAGELSRHFDKIKDGFKVKRNIREMAVFAVQNLIKDPPFTKMDLISCRNLLIYLQPVLQKRVLSIFNYALIPDGFLFLGSSETIGEQGESFTAEDSRNRIFRHYGRGSLPLKDPSGMPQHFMLPKIDNDFGLQELKCRNRYDAQEKYYQELVSRLSNLLLVVNENRELVQTFGEGRGMLSIANGNVSLDVLTLLPREIALAVSSGIHRVRKERKPVAYGDIAVKSDPESRHYDVRIDSTTEGAQGSLFLIDISPSSGAAPCRPDAEHEDDPGIDERINDLEQEVQFTRENLQATIEELQTSNEELQATNEELLAANEELQSTNEELQSVNEELNTVNTEYQEKNLELGALNSDMRNLMGSTDIGTVFLDRELRIRRFTPAMTRYVNILEQDVGRPLHDLSVPFLANLEERMRGVLRDGGRVEAPMQYRDGHMLLRMLPFHGENETIEGVVLTLIDITDQKAAERALLHQYELIARALECSPLPHLMVDAGGRIEFANRRALHVFALPPRELFKLYLHGGGLGLLDENGEPFTEETSPFALVREAGEDISDAVVRVSTLDGERPYFLSVSPLLDENGAVDGAVLMFSKSARSG